MKKEKTEEVIVVKQFGKAMQSFKDRVLNIVKQIPKGTVLSYGQVAMQAGAKGAARAVGSIMSHNQDKGIPCHRVVKSDGSIGHYNGLRGKVVGNISPSQNKINLLKKEGVKFTKTNKIILSADT